MSILPSQRHLFDIPERIAYFNCAYYSPQLNESQVRLVAGVQAKGRPWERIPGDFFDDAETIRRSCSELFGGDADGYAVVHSASYGLSTAARAIEPHLKPGDRILVMADEFPSNVLPWQRTARETGASLVTVAAPDNGNWTQAVLDRIEPGVKVVAASTCRWTDGAHVDLQPISKACIDHGIALVVDATQSLGAIPCSMAEIAPDFLVAAGYKWLLGPYGFGMLYVSARWRGARPLEESWLARLNADNFTALADYSDAYMSGARRFETGEKCTPTILPGAIAALEQIKAWGIDNIAATLSAVNARIAGHLERLGFELPPEAQRSAHMFGALIPATYRGNLVAELRQREIYVSQRGNALRFAPHLHVNQQDVDRMLDVLDALTK
ncbi:MAG: aminotransferase class V-fold PLP-dependent enzyme [Betaproteobacteria bacterium]